jgi:hypothetical protein
MINLTIVHIKTFKLLIITDKRMLLEYQNHKPLSREKCQEEGNPLWVLGKAKIGTATIYLHKSIRCFDIGIRNE